MPTTGSELFARIWKLTGGAREQAIKEAAGSHPSWFPGWTAITVSTGSEKGGHVLTYHAAADGLTIGTNADFRRMPVAFRTAREIAAAQGWTFPTARMVEQIHNAARYRVAMPTYETDREGTPTYQKAHDAIEAQLAAIGASSRQLVSGGKKDLVLSSHLPPGTKQIFGGRQSAAADSPIWQGLSYPPAHDDLYVDYSEQYRPIRRDAMLDGRPIDIHAILSDPALASLLSGETPATRKSVV